MGGTAYPILGIAPLAVFAIILYAPALAWWLERRDRKQAAADAEA